MNESKLKVPIDVAIVSDVKVKDFLKDISKIKKNLSLCTSVRINIYFSQLQTRLKSAMNKSTLMKTKQMCSPIWTPLTPATYLLLLSQFLCVNSNTMPKKKGLNIYIAYPFIHERAATQALCRVGQNGDPCGILK